MKKTNTTILILDDNEEILIAARMLLKRHFETVITTTNPKKIPELLSEHPIEIILLDMNYRLGYEDGKEGIFWFKEIKKIAPQVQIVLMTSYSNIETAVEGIKLGAIDYILKPWNNDQLLNTIKETVKQFRKKVIDTTIPTISFFKGTAPSILKVYEMADRVSKTDVNTLILGENGTGKYVLAKYIHDQSARKNQAFIHVDLGSLNENLFESELFGYAKGAFTDAKQDTAGRFEMAHGGTIFLDEIGNVPLHLQSKLLQIIQSKSITRLGESKTRAVDVRIITATNADIETEVERKFFREDLYYRINTVVLTLPSLRERREDIAPLMDFFLNQNAKKYDREIPTIDSQTRTELSKYDWKGNIREMQNRVERAMILSDSAALKLADFGISALAISPYEDEASLHEIERVSILKAMNKCQGNISQTALELGLSRSALYRRLEKHNIK
ncbi:sigma-54 dependent transcriptional regulator [Flavobacterium sp. HSC-61S13]|uniref:sigma-54-dependent transcriptional regulator n=1 Tax=Flavobacterium sp. HSC-61S13 TaxID=2910963 RepID=UPI00209ED522|nr:sigma-54 dependent transcriptional regulator [Flavobacterium sp. HSC-61S13]MCP1995336.1 DNA-binding NtrC family response regulator [Flavobacterium sp. HSC-61S13]